MSLEVGRKLAHYEILEPIGKGGMGEVYRARDGKLGRDVAIKVLPDEFSRDKERLARFKREAKILASLNHPNIAAIYGLEQSGSIHYLVLELVPGETLAERIARGPIPVDEAVEIATKITEGLEEAHERGIIHRDLKPANVKLTPDGKVKILDFGLAKAFVEEAPEADSSMSPTITRDATRVGVILGTAAYMSPEQAKGKQLDRRTDIFAFGAVLYEMLTGKKAFRGDNVSEVLASVMKDEPDWDVLPGDSIQRVIRRCLTKPAGRRFQHIGDVRIDLQEPQTEDVTTSVRADRSKSLLLVVTLFTAAVAVWSLFRSDAPVPLPVSRWNISLPGGVISLGLGQPSVTSAVAISPNGSHLAYVVEHTGTTQLYIRTTGQLEAVAIDGGEDAIMPFFSPDSQSLGFAKDSGALMKVSVHGGAPVVISQVGRNVRGASWSSDEHIFFNSGFSGGLRRVPADGGEQELLASPRPEQREKAYRFAEVLPGGKAVLFTVVTHDIESFDDASIAVVSLERGEVRTLVEGGSSAHYSPTGHLVYARGGALFAVSFDPSALEVIGAPVRVLDGVTTWPTMGAAEFSLSRDGALLHAPGGPLGIDYRVVWVDRAGTSTPFLEETHAFHEVRLSPDGRSLAVSTNDANMNLWGVRRSPSHPDTSRLRFQQLDTRLDAGQLEPRVCFRSRSAHECLSRCSRRQS